MHPYLDIDYSYLRAPNSFINKPTKEDLYNQTGDRKIFYEIEPTAKEIDTIEKFKNKWNEVMSNRPTEESIALPSYWVLGDYIRYANTNEFDVDRMVAQIELNQNWIRSLKDFNLSEMAADFLNNGSVYIAGRDKKGIPVMIFSTKGIKKLSKEVAIELTKAMTFCLLIIKKYMFVPGHIEKFHFFMDLNNSSLSPQPDLIKGLISLFQDNYNGFAGTCYIYNPNWFFKVTWKMIEVFLPKKTLERVRFVEKKKEREYASDLDLDDLQAKYGGNVPNLEENFWPPNQKAGVVGVTHQFMKQNNIKEFTILGADDYKIFRGDKAGSIRVNTGNFKEESFLSAKSGRSNIGKKKVDTKKPQKLNFWDKFKVMCCGGRNKEFDAKNEEAIRDAANRSIKESKRHSTSNMSRDSKIEYIPRNDRSNVQVKGILRNDENKKLGVPNRVT